MYPLGAGVIGLLGPNGAGKTTLLNILATVTKPTEGMVIWNGTDVSRSPQVIRSVLGYLPQYFGVYPNLNPIEFLQYLAALKGISRKDATQRIDRLVQMLNLTDVRKRLLGGFSGGMKQRVGIAQALLNDPELLIVDEPTSGLDPEERVRFRNLLSDLSGDRIVILSTHVVPDIEAAANEIILISGGRLLQKLSPEELLLKAEGKVWQWVIPSNQLSELQKTHQVSSALRRSDGVHVRIVADQSPGTAAQTSRPTMEDAYLYYTANPDSSSLTTD